MSSAAHRQEFERQFRGVFRDEFQAWFSRVARLLHPPGALQTVRGTQGDGGLDCLTIDRRRVYQCFAPPRLNEARDATTATKIRRDFSAARESLGEAMAEWVFVHNHPEGHLGKKANAALLALKADNPSVTILAWGIKELGDELSSLPDDVLAREFGSVANEPSTTVAAMTLLTGAYGVRGAQAVEQLRRLAENPLIDAVRDAEDAVAVTRQAVEAGDLPVEVVAQLEVLRRPICSACGRNAGIGRIVRPLMDYVALSSAIDRWHRLDVLLNAVSLAVLEGKLKHARRLLSRTSAGQVGEFLRSLPPNRLKALLKAKVLVDGVDTEAGYLLRNLVKHDLLDHDAAAAARCLACKAVATGSSAAPELIELARRYAGDIADQAVRRDMQRGVEAIAVVNELKERTTEGLFQLRGDRLAQQLLDRVRNMPDGKHQLRRAEAALFAWYSHLISGDISEANTARELLATMEARGKETHCLFDLNAFGASVRDSGQSSGSASSPAE